MKIGIIGYGKMGKAIEKIAIDRGHSISFKTNDFNLNLIKDVDVTIEFSTPESAFTPLVAYSSVMVLAAGADKNTSKSITLVAFPSSISML